MSRGNPELLKRMGLPIETWSGMSPLSKQMTVASFFMLALRQQVSQQQVKDSVDLIDMQIQTGLWWYPPEMNA